MSCVVAGATDTASFGACFVPGTRCGWWLSSNPSAAKATNPSPACLPIQANSDGPGVRMLRARRRGSVPASRSVDRVVVSLQSGCRCCADTTKAMLRHRVWKRVAGDASFRSWFGSCPGSLAIFEIPCLLTYAHFGAGAGNLACPLVAEAGVNRLK